MSVSIQEAKERVLNLASSLSEVFIGRENIIRTMVTAAVAREPLLFVGPPGTAKSMLISSFCKSLGVGDGDYFEYMLTRYSEPSEILGPVDISELKEGYYVRRVSGQLPEAKIAFLDEIFKANSAILNVLLTLINERKFYQDGRPVSVPLRMLFAASNEIPTFGEFDALKDRFILKVETRPVQNERFWDLIQVGFSLDSRGDSYQKLQSMSALGASLEDIDVLYDYLQGTILARAALDRGNPFGDENMSSLFRSLITMIQEDEKISVTDRKVIKLAKLILADAMIFNDEKVDVSNFHLMAYAGNDFTEIRRLEMQVRERLAGIGSAV